jgi:hypothetical protein
MTRYEEIEVWGGVVNPEVHIEMDSIHCHQKVVFLIKLLLIYDRREWKY